MSGSMTSVLATREELMARKRERPSRWPALTATKGKSGAAPPQRARSKIPATTRVMGAKRKARTIVMVVYVANEWDERQEDICEEGLGIWVTATRGLQASSFIRKNRTR